MLAFIFYFLLFLNAFLDPNVALSIFDAEQIGSLAVGGRFAHHRPRNICRLADLTFRLIDFDMAFAPGPHSKTKGLANNHATAKKIESTNAYVAYAGLA